MVAKKSNNANLENKKSLFVLIGFVIVLSLLYIALEWSQSDVKKYVGIDFDKKFIEDLDIPQTAEKRLPPPPPPPPVKVIEEIKIVDNTTETKRVDFTSESGNKDIIGYIGNPVPINKTEEVNEVPFVYVEKMPEFPGNVFKFLSENIHYPQNAIDGDIQGKVYCEFVVNRDGSIVDIVVVRSVHPSLDKEAMRVIKLMPKWSPGLQRGKPVRVKYTLPVSFKLMM
ncbi:MAG: energy transducer TonB [Paludibacter sp.]|nr:energy transducer TonB [Paludibacter sp.]